MINIGIIGTGHIFKKQILALEKLKNIYKIVGLCDIDRQKLITCGIDNVPKYDNLMDFLSETEADSILIATPPHTHYEIARKAILKKKNILLEKPAVLNIEQLNELYDLAQKNNVILHIAFHAAFAKDLIWFLENREQIINNKIKKIECCCYDPYMENDTIIKERIPLGGCYIDSGVNALSVCDKLVDLNLFHFEKGSEIKDKTENQTTYNAEHLFKSDECEIIIKTAWDKGINKKYTVLEFYGTKQKIKLDHSEQKVICINEDEQNVIYYFNEEERLPTHYNGVFCDYYNAIQNKTNNKEHAIAIHTALFSGAKYSRHRY